ncbi:uncharacterized protein RCC_01224 [Ramularia collo-cygni]|uniref:BTB domain-containing protein n=1 Tax=Ramularia collo-cygni TaxID=112498 RepID=A0A2D3UMI9_9PEZI|nr:uncharacterized protein RCC_01224 [Ramularia collo-cygni]CZT15361.1 uncharacterized protein RCC_01224 [Ramularia collo-cygni]
MICGKMQECLEGVATIEDVDAETFTRVCEYMYTGDYNAAEHAVFLNRDAEKEDLGDKMFHKAKHMAYTANFTSPRGPSAYARKAFENRVWARESMKSNSIYRRNAGPSEDYSEVFLSHAQVYVFADKYDISALRSLALHHLHKTLVSFTLYPEGVCNVAKLFRYVYHHTAERDGKMDELRALVIEYAACYIEDMVANEVFQEVLRAENSASVDLIVMLLGRLK